MPTYRKDVKIGTMIPLIKTDDISDGAITKDKLDKDLRDEIQPKKKEKTKKRKQIIIGRAIRPGSVKRSDVENWYAFIANPCFTVYDPQDDLVIHLYTQRYGNDGYEEVNVKCIARDLIGNKRFNFDHPYLCAMYKVDNFSVNGNDYNIYLTYRDAPRTLKGQSITQEWQNGKRVCNKKIPLEVIREDLINLVKNNRHLNNKFEYRRIKSCWKTREKRESVKIYPFLKKKCRREVNWLITTYTRKGLLETGLYKVRYVCYGYKTNWQTIYVKREARYSIKNVVFK